MANYYDFTAIQKYTIGKYALREIKKITFGLGKKYLIIVDRHISQEIVDDITASFTCTADSRPEAPENIIGKAAGLLNNLNKPLPDDYHIDFSFYEMPGNVCSYGNAIVTAKKIEETGADVVVAVGGSKCLDLVRAATHYVDCYDRPKIVMCPTVVTSNACATGMSVMYDDSEHKITDFWSLAAMPECVIVDTNIIVHSLPKFLKAAVGDQISSCVEALHTLKYIGEYESCDRLCVAHHNDVLNVLEQYSCKAVSDMEKNIISHEFEWVCHAVTRYTGPELAVGTAYLSHILDEAIGGLPELSKWMHGDIVGYGVLPDMVASGTPDEIYKWVDLYEKIGIPYTLEQLGIGNYSRNDILECCRRSADGIMASRAIRRWKPEEMADAVFEADSLVKKYIKAKK